MLVWIGLAVGILSIAVAIIMWLLRKRTQSGYRHRTRFTFAHVALHLLPLTFGLMACSQAIGLIRPAQVLWSVLTAVFGFMTLGCAITLIARASDLRQS
jgi:hypothetical protein